MNDAVLIAEDVQTQIERNYRWNFLVNALAGAMSYQSMFIVSAVFGIASWACLHIAVREPRLMPRQQRTEPDN